MKSTLIYCQIEKYLTSLYPIGELFQKYKPSFKTIILFKSEWKGDHPVKDIENKKFKFHFLSYGKNLLYDHQGSNVQGHQSQLFSSMCVSLRIHACWYLASITIRYKILIIRNPDKIMYSLRGKEWICRNMKCPKEHLLRRISIKLEKK